MNITVISRHYRPYFWLLFVAVLGFIFVPSNLDGGLSRRNFQIGWPLPTMVLRIGSVSTGNPTGLYADVNGPAVLVALTNVALWLIVLFGLQWVVAKFRVSDQMLYLGVVIMTCVSLAVCISGGASFLVAMIFG